MTKKDEKYFNFPVMLLSGFMDDSRGTLSNILDYSLFAWGIVHYEFGDLEERMKSAAKNFHVSLGNLEASFENGSNLYEDLPLSSPKVGLSISLFWDYYGNDKSDFEKACLLAFLAIKSILHKKPYCKVTNNYLLSRMDGKAKSVESTDNLHPAIRRYSNEYQLKKIKTELIQNWNLKHYSRYTRGFYVSLTMPLEELVFQVESKRKGRLKKKLADDQKVALNKALKRLENN